MCQILPIFPNARMTPHEIYVPIDPDGGLYVYSFGALVTHDVAQDRREAELARLRALVPKLTAQVVREDYTVALAGPGNHSTTASSIGV